MNKEVGYIMQGFLLMMVLLGAIALIRFIVLLPSHNDPETTVTVTTSSQSKFIVANARGRELFYNNCASCHSISKVLTGPALAGVEERIQDKKLLYAWIRNSDAVLKTGNKYFKGLVQKFEFRMIPFPDLSNEEIAAILEYIKQRAAPQYSSMPGVAVN